MEHVLEAGGLRIVFHRRADRWAHTVQAFSGGEFRTLLESIEGDASDPWPPSPPLQQLHFEERPGGQRVALLVGMAGTSHWSSSVVLDPRRGEAEVEVACRLRATPRRLGSRYRRCGAGAELRALAGVLTRTADAEWVGPAAAEIEIPSTIGWKYAIAGCGASLILPA